MRLARKTKIGGETLLVKHCLEYLNLRNIHAWRNNSGAVKSGKRFIKFGQVGSPDILGILPYGRLLCVECKIGKNKLSRSQEDWLKRAAEAGAKTCVVYSLEELMQEV